MIVNLKLTIAGIDTGPFDIYATDDTTLSSWVGPVDTGISRTELVNGYNCDTIPNDSLYVKVKSTNMCTTEAIAPIKGGAIPASYIHLGLRYVYDTYEEACTDTPTINYYSTTGILNLNAVVYTDVSCTTPFPGDSIKWIKLQYTPNSGIYCAYRIDENGVILELILCNPD